MKLIAGSGGGATVGGWRASGCCGLSVRIVAYLKRTDVGVSDLHKYLKESIKHKDIITNHIGMRKRRDLLD